jgi:hypothetical protein
LSCNARTWILLGALHSFQPLAHRFIFLLSCFCKQIQDLFQNLGSILGIQDPSIYPEYVLALHSSKRLLIEQLNSSYHMLADAIINLTLAKGN